MNRILSFSLTLLSALLFFSCGPEDPFAGMKRTPSGYPYEFYKKGEGPKVQTGDRISYHEIGYRNDSLWYSTVNIGRPRRTTYPGPENVGRPIPPPYEALQLMTQGDCLKVYQSLDTFSNLPDYLKNEDELAFVIELISRTSKEEWEAEKNKMTLLDSLATQQTLGLLDEYQSGKLKDRLQETESGLKYIIHEKGEGPPVLRKKRLKTHYAGFLMDGTPFDSSFKKGQPFEMQTGVGSVIPAWDEGVALLQEGGKATLFIPAELGYGGKGFSNLIPPNSDLVFYIEVVDVID